MESEKKYIIIGATHTGISLAKKLTALSLPVLLIDTKTCPDRLIKEFYYQVSIMDDAIMREALCYFVTFDEDSANIRLCLAINKLHNNAQIFTMLAEESLGDKVSHYLPNFHYINPAKQAAIQFVKTALDNLEDIGEETFKWKRIEFKLDVLVKKALIFILGTMSISVLFFHYYDNLPWIDSFYFTVTMMATVGFGDYSLKDNSNLSKIVGSIIMLLSITGTAIIFALVSDNIIRKRKELSMVLSRYKGNGHVLVIGSGSVGFNVARLLTQMNEKAVILDKTLDGRYSQQAISHKIPYLVGNAQDVANLYRAGLGRCKVIICATQDDLTNLEIGLNARTARPELRVVLRIYDQNLAANLRDSLGIKYTLSMSFIAADEFIEMSNRYFAS